jgi:hypothetical protein
MIWFSDRGQIHYPASGFTKYSITPTTESKVFCENKCRNNVSLIVCLFLITVFHIVEIIGKVNSPSAVLLILFTYEYYKFFVLGLLFNKILDML